MLATPSPIPTNLSHNSAGSRALVPPSGREDTDCLVVTRQTVDSRLDQNEAELRVLVFSVALEVLADGDSLGPYVSGRVYSPVRPSAHPTPTFLINMYRSSGSSGARPVLWIITLSARDQAEAFVRGTVPTDAPAWILYLRVANCQLLIGSQSYHWT